MGILLTPEEIQQVKTSDMPIAKIPKHTVEIAIAKAQAKKIVAWGDEKCPHWNSEWHLKHYCPKCWQELQKECE